MYNSSYSRAKLGPDSRQHLYRNKGKSCGYYMRIVFFFSSLIQSLIIISLVLFLIYGQPEKSAEEKRVEELEQGFNKLSKNNIELRKEKVDLGAQLAARTAEKAALEKEMAKQQIEGNHTVYELKKKMEILERFPRCPPSLSCRSPPPPPVTFNNGANTLKSIITQKERLIGLINSNFTQMVEYLRQERDNALRDRNVQLEEGIKLRRENSLLLSQLATYTRKCKEDFTQSLNEIQKVTSMFLDKINNLYPHSQRFHLSCDNQGKELENIKSSCSNLSRDMENKFQLYLNTVGDKVAEIEWLTSKLEVEKSDLTSTLQQCENKHKNAVAKAASDLAFKQKSFDDQLEKLLMEQDLLRKQQKLQEERLALKDKEIQTLQGLMVSKIGPATAASPQTGPQQGRHAAMNWHLGGTTNKPSMVG